MNTIPGYDFNFRATSEKDSDISMEKSGVTSLRRGNQLMNSGI